MIDLVFYNRTGQRQFSRRFFFRWLKTTARVLALDRKKNWSLSLSLVRQSTMAKLHQRFLNRPGGTDVLSFPLRGAKEAFCFNAAGVIMELGDLFLCPAFIAQKVKRRKRDLNPRLAVLTVHGFLHLLGFDHQGAVQTRRMQRWEEKIKKQLWPKQKPRSE